MFFGFVKLNFQDRVPNVVVGNQNNQNKAGRDLQSRPKRYLPFTVLSISTKR